MNTSSNSTITDLTDSYANHPSLFSLDIKAIANFAMQMSKKKNNDGKQNASKVFESFDRIVFYGGKYENGAALSTAELQFSNKEENSLKQFIKIIEMAVNMEMKGKKTASSDKEETLEGENAEVKLDKIEYEKEDHPLPPPPPPKPKTKSKIKIDKN